MEWMVDLVKNGNGEAVEENTECLEHEDLASDLLKRLVEVNEAKKKGSGKGNLTEGKAFSNAFVCRQNTITI